MGYKDTWTWKQTLGNQSYPGESMEGNCVRLMRTSYDTVRAEAELLAANISESLPFFTRHDISHVDALWDAADTLLWDETHAYPLNPAEGYVLGLAFLLHDLGMGLAAYTEGLQGIRGNEYYRDAVASEFLRQYGRAVRDEDWRTLDGELSALDGTNREVVGRALTDTLRDLHAKKAETLALQKWAYAGKEQYFIEDTFLREAFGELAGKIAASHGWSYDRLKDTFPDAPQGTPGSFPQAWKVDARKLACILRAADAVQIDDRRAPSFLMTLRQPEGESLNHWLFQNKLSQPTVRKERLYFNSKSAFRLDEMDAWWLCHDTLRMVDSELRDADTLLLETGRTPFRVRGVYGLSSAKELSRYIRADGWIPLDTTIRVGDVGRLVSMLGGAQLYGPDSGWVPFRELIQNGADAIRARKLLEDPEIPCRENDYGDVVISFEEKDGEHWISFTDNGVGMSETVLTGPFLDFGQSFWNTPLMNREWPGLAARGFRSTGQYGIGFYSVFMWSGEVKVITRRYDKGRDETLVLEFKSGADSRPVLRSATKEEQRLVRDGGTKVSIKISDNLMERIRDGKIWNQDETLEDSLAKLCPCLDCNLYLDGSKTAVVQANDWLALEPMDFVKRLVGPAQYMEERSDYRETIELLAPNMEIIYEGTSIVGRAFLIPSGFGIGLSVIGGCRGSALDLIGGVLTGKTIRASRDQIGVYLQADTIRKWAISQMEKVRGMDLPGSVQEKISMSLFYLGIKPIGLKFADLRTSSISVTPWGHEDIVELIQSNSYENFFIICSGIGAKGAKLYTATQGKFTEGLTFIATQDGYKILRGKSINTGIEWFHEIEWLKTCGVSRLSTKDFADLFIDAVMDGLGVDQSERSRHLLTDMDLFYSLMRYAYPRVDYDDFRETEFHAIITREEIKREEESS